MKRWREALGGRRRQTDWKSMLVLHTVQTEACSQLDALRGCRNQLADKFDLRRELAPLVTAVQPDLASISEQVSAWLRWSQGV